jgi:multicomponent Na+:H+ antiporter subunit G
MRAYFYDAAVILSVAVMTLGVLGIWRMPDIYTKLHAASKAVFLGVVVLALSSTVIAEGAMVYRAVLVSVIVVITTPLSSHVIGRAAFLLQERMETPGAVDESGSNLKDEPPTWRL